MCEFVSFAVTEGPEPKFICGTRLNSHGGITQENHGRTRYREGEWTEDDNGASLVVRVLDGEDPNEWANKVTSAFPDRWSLIVHLLKQIGKRETADLSGCTWLKTLPEGFNPKTANLSGCTGLKTLPEGFNPKTANLSGCTGLKTLPEGFNPKTAYLSGCTGLKTLPEGFNPKYANLSGCTGLKVKAAK